MGGDGIRRNVPVDDHFNLAQLFCLCALLIVAVRDVHGGGGIERNVVRGYGYHFETVLVGM